VPSWPRTAMISFRTRFDTITGSQARRRGSVKEFPVSPITTGNKGNTKATPDRHPMTDFGDELHRVLTEQGISLRQAARRAGCSPGYLSNVAGGRNPLRRASPTSWTEHSAPEKPSRHVRAARAAAMDAPHQRPTWPELP
jgi:hypothetical protein